LIGWFDRQLYYFTFILKIDFRHAMYVSNQSDILPTFLLDWYVDFHDMSWPLAKVCCFVWSKAFEDNASATWPWDMLASW